MNASIRIALILLSCAVVLGCGSRMASDADSTNVAVTDDPLYVAIRSGKLSKVKDIIANDPDALYRGDGALGETPLHEAVAAGEIEIARFLIESGADVNAVDNRRGTPLTTAMEVDASDEMIQLLEEHGAED